MKRAPNVPGEVENAIIDLAAQYVGKTHMHVFSESDRLYVHVMVQYGSPFRWQLSDFYYPIEQLEGTLQSITRNAPWSLNKTNVLYEWDAKARRLKKRIVGPADSGAVA